MKTHTYAILMIVVCLALSACEKELDYSVPIDGDGNEYATVAIGTQVWMAGALRTTKLNDGTSLAPLQGADWNAPTSPAYCYYNDDISNAATYGALYNFAAVNTGLLAPKGWHVATNEDWKVLSNYLGGLSQAGGKLKATHTWFLPNEGATNESGLGLLPTGYCDADGKFYELGEVGYWWTSSPAPGGDQAWMRFLKSESAALEGNSSAFQLGYAVLCVKDVL